MIIGRNGSDQGGMYNSHEVHNGFQNEREKGIKWIFFLYR
jgi:hypothetical protein